MTKQQVKDFFRTVFKVVAGGPAVGTPGANRSAGTLAALDLLADFAESQSGAPIVATELTPDYFLISPALYTLGLAALHWLPLSGPPVPLDQASTLTATYLRVINRPLDGSTLAYVDASGAVVPVPTNVPGPYIELALADTVSMLAADPPVLPWRLYAITGKWNGAVTGSTVYVAGLTDRRWADAGWVLAANGEPQSVRVDVAAKTYTELLSANQLARLAPVWVNDAGGGFTGFQSLAAAAADNATSGILQDAVLTFNEAQQLTAAIISDIRNASFALRGSGQLLYATGATYLTLPCANVADISLSHLALNGSLFRAAVSDCEIAAGDEVVATDCFWDFAQGSIAGTLRLRPGTTTDGTPTLVGSGQVIDERGGAGGGPTYTAGAGIDITNNVISAKGGGIDYATPLVCNENTPTLSFGRLHLFDSQATGFHAVSLPSPTGQANKLLYIEILSTTKGVWDFTGSGYSISLWAAETVLLRVNSAGTGYERLSGNKVTMAAQLAADLSGNLSLSTGVVSDGSKPGGYTLYTVPLPRTAMDRSSGMVDATRPNALVIQRSGLYRVEGFAFFTAAAGLAGSTANANLLVNGQVDGSTQLIPDPGNLGTNGLRTSRPGDYRQLVRGDVLTYGYYTDTNGIALQNQASSAYYAPHLTVTEQPS